MYCTYTIQEHTYIQDVAIMSYDVIITSYGIYDVIITSFCIVFSDFTYMIINSLYDKHYNYFMKYFLPKFSKSMS